MASQVAPASGGFQLHRDSRSFLSGLDFRVVLVVGTAFLTYKLAKWTFCSIKNFVFPAVGGGIRKIEEITAAAFGDSENFQKLVKNNATNSELMGSVFQKLIENNHLEGVQKMLQILSSSVLDELHFWRALKITGDPNILGTIADHLRGDAEKWQKVIETIPPGTIDQNVAKIVKILVQNGPVLLGGGAPALGILLARAAGQGITDVVQTIISRYGQNLSPEQIEEAFRMANSEGQKVISSLIRVDTKSLSNNFDFPTLIQIFGNHASQPVLESDAVKWAKDFKDIKLSDFLNRIFVLPQFATDPKGLMDWVLDLLRFTSENAQFKEEVIRILKDSHPISNSVMHSNIDLQWTLNRLDAVLQCMRLSQDEHLKETFLAIDGGKPLGQEDRDTFIKFMRCFQKSYF